MTNVEGRGIPRERDGPAQTEEQIAMEAIDVVIRSWFNGAEDGWPKLHDYERQLMLKLRVQGGNHAHVGHQASTRPHGRVHAPMNAGLGNADPLSHSQLPPCFAEVSPRAMMPAWQRPHRRVPWTACRPTPGASWSGFCVCR